MDSLPCAMLCVVSLEFSHQFPSFFLLIVPFYRWRNCYVLHSRSHHFRCWVPSFLPDALFNISDIVKMNLSFTSPSVFISERNTGILFSNMGKGHLFCLLTCLGYTSRFMLCRYTQGHSVTQLLGPL